MTRRHLFGPVTPQFADDHLGAHRSAGVCRTFGFEPGPGIDAVVGFDATWADLARHGPPDWQPELLVLWLPYEVVPPALWDAPVPIAGLATDWNLLWHGYRRVWDHCEVLFTDAPGVAAFSAGGSEHVREANLFGPGRPYREYPWPSADDPGRDIDLLFVGNTHAAIHRDRLPWVGRLARMADRWRVVVRAGVFGDDYRRLLARTRLVFNRAVRGECNQRAFEAALAGAVLLQERENVDVARYFVPGEEYAPYTAEDLEAVVERYLSRPAERARVAVSARVRVAHYSFETFWAEALARLESEWADLATRAASRRHWKASDHLMTRAVLAVGATHPGRDDSLVLELDRATDSDPGNAKWPVAAAAVAVAQGARPADQIARLGRAATGGAPDPVALAALAEALDAAGRHREGADVARAALNGLGTDPPAASLADPFFLPPGFTALRVEWERAGGSHAGDPGAEAAAKCGLLRAHLHGLLAARTGDVALYEAAAREPAFPKAQAALGCALARAGRGPEAIPRLRAVVATDPFDRPAARALFQVLLDAGDGPGQAGLVAESRLLHRAAPGLVPPEPWFGPAAPAQTRVVSMSRAEFAVRVGDADTSRALIGYTNAADTHAILALVAHFRPRRILEIGTALGHMTANFTEWSPDDASIFSLGDVADLPAGRGAGQAYETPPRAAFGAQADHFGKAHKVFLVTADSLHYDFARLAPLDFAFVDGAHDLAHALSDTEQAYAALAPGGVLVWHDFGSRTPWVRVRQAVEAAALAEVIWHVEATEVAFLVKRSDAPPPLPLAARRRPDDDRPVRVAWEGDVTAVHSLALVNRALAERLSARGHPISVRPTVRVPGAAPAEPGPVDRLVGRRLPAPPEVTVRHRWPPDFSAAMAGRVVMMQPWEYGRIPAAWVPAIHYMVDEVWVPTRYVRACFVDSGVPADRVHVIPFGADVTVFRPGRDPLPLKTGKRVRLLFVGGTLWRKGFDVLLAAYGKAFTAADDVCLVVKDMGVGTFYRGQTAEGQIKEFRARPRAPEVEHLTDPLTADQVAGLYAACDALVHPYRGEGFGLPVAEAMACGLPVVVTAGGATDDWCDDANAYRVPARRVDLSEARVGGLDTAGPPWMLEPDANALAEILRHLVARPAETAARARAGCAVVRGRLTWDHAAAAVETRLRALAALRPQSAAVSVPAPPPAARPRVSLTMIVRNEEHHLPDCLASVRDLVDEMVVVDTGSTDRTKEVARSFGARVFDFPWVDSFSAARNAALAHATGEWSFWMDADDRLDDVNRQKIAALFASLPDGNVAYSMKCHCLGDGPGAATTVDHMRLFRNRAEHRWKYRVHEQILPSIRKAGGEVRFADVIITHVGYADPAARRRKLDRDLRLLSREAAEQPDDPFTLFNLGSVYHELGRPAEAAGFLRKSIDRSHPKDSIVRKLFALLAQCQRQLGRPDDALTTCAEGRAHYPEDTELLFVEAVARREKRDFAGAEACLKRLLDGPGEGDHFASVTEGLRGHKARHNLAVMYLEMHREAEAEVEWQKALEEEPLFLSAQAGMGEVYLRLKRWDELEDRARRMEALGREGELHAEALRGRAHLERGEAAAARWGLGRACERFPDSLTLRVLHSHAALKEGLDREAEAALLAVLDLAPSHAEARQNLAVLRARRRLKPGEEITLAGLFAASCARDDDAAGPLTALRDLARGCQRVVQFGAGAGEVTTALLMGRPGELVCCDRARAPELDLLEALAGKTKFEFRLADQRLDDEMDLLVVSDPTLASIRRVLERSVTTALRLVIVHGPNDVDHSDSGLVAAGFRPAGGGRPVAGLSVWERNGSRG